MTPNKFFSVGSDPEVFLRNSKGQLVSAIGVIPGTKREPHKTAHGSIQYDNILAEFNSTPSLTSEQFLLNHRNILNDLMDVCRPLDLQLDMISSVLADKSLLSDIRAQEAGCEPDFDAWSVSMNRRVDYSKTNIRAAGGHLHVAFDQAVGSLDNRLNFVKSMDLVLGVPSVLLDSDNTRRQYYGKAGAHRPKDSSMNDPYDGVEYRTLSNFWLTSDKLMEFVFNRTLDVYENLEEVSSLAMSLKSKIIKCINTGDKKLAEFIINQTEKNLSLCQLN